MKDKNCVKNVQKRISKKPLVIRFLNWNVTMKRKGKKYRETIKPILDIADILIQSECFWSTRETAIIIATELYKNGCRKVGKAKWKRTGGTPEAICSNCNSDVCYQIVDGRWRFDNYCAHCGCEMEVE